MAVDLLDSGMKPDETYSQFLHRIARDVRIYGISDNNEIILAQLQEAMPDAAAAGIAVHKITNGQNGDIKFTSINEIVKFQTLISAKPPVTQRLDQSATHTNPIASLQTIDTHSTIMVTRATDPIRPRVELT